MKERPYFKFYPSDWLNSVSVSLMDHEQRGAYIHLLCLCWIQEDCALRTTVEQLFSLCSFSASKDFTPVQRMFVKHPTIKGALTNPRLYEEYVNIAKRSEIQAKKGVLSGIARRMKIEPVFNNGSTTVEPNANPIEPVKRREIRDKRRESSPDLSSSDSSSPQTPSSTLQSLETPDLKSRSRTKIGKNQPKSAAVWEAYRSAYARRYQVDPVRNAGVNAILGRLVDKLGANEAPQVAAFYLTHHLPFYVTKRHPVTLLLADAEGLRTQWATGAKATTGEARNMEAQDEARAQIKRVETLLKGVAR